MEKIEDLKQKSRYLESTMSLTPRGTCSKGCTKNARVSKNNLKRGYQTFDFRTYTWKEFNQTEMPEQHSTAGDNIGFQKKNNHSGFT